MHTALTIAGSDSGGGAGIQADLATFAALGVFGLSAVTAVTAQSTTRVGRVLPLPADVVVDQIDVVLDDISADATKIGMLATRAIVDAVADVIVRHRLPHVVLDTVFGSTTGTPLLDTPGIEALGARLLPLAEVVTANTLEAARLLGQPVVTLDGARAAARGLTEIGARAAIVKGGHLEGPDAIDVLYDGARFEELRAPRIDTRHTHGTGCTFAAAMAARLACGDDLVTAARAAKIYVTDAIRHAPSLGHGHGPLGHFWPRAGDRSRRRG